MKFSHRIVPFFQFLSTGFAPRSLIFVLIGLGLFSCDDDNPAIKNSIEIVSIDPAPSSKLDETSVISTTLKYTIEAKEKSEYGFKIKIMFTRGSDSTKSFSVQPNTAVLSSYSGTVKLDHDLVKEWNDDTRHPIQCHFDLLKETSLGKYQLLAETEKITFSE